MAWDVGKKLQKEYMGRTGLGSITCPELLIIERLIYFVDLELKRSESLPSSFTNLILRPQSSFKTLILNIRNETCDCP